MINQQTGERITFPESRHAAIIGQSGCGKTNLVALPLFARAIRKGRRAIFFDLSGAPATAHEATAIAEAAGRRIRFVSTNDALDSEYINTLHPGPFPASDALLVGTILEGAGIHRGSAYGVSYFADACVAAVSEVVAHLRAEALPITVPAVAEHVRRVSHKGTDHIEYALSILARFRCLTDPPPGASVLTWHEAYERGDVIFIHAPTRNAAHAAKVAAMIHQSFLAYLESRLVAGQELYPTEIGIDEAALLMGQQAATALAMVRVLEVTYRLYAQTIEQLDAADSRTTGQIILDNCASLMLMTPFSDREVKLVQAHSADARYWLESRSTGPSGPTVTKREDRNYKASRDEILRVANTPQCAVIIRRSEQGAAEPIPVFMDFTVPRELFEAQSRKPLPLRCDPAPVVFPVPHGPLNPLRDATFEARAEKIAEVFGRLNSTFRLGGGV